MNQNRTLTEEIRLSVYWGMLLGGLAGLALALQHTYFDNHYIQKGLSFFVLEIFFERVLFGVAAGFAIFFALLPAVSCIDQKVSRIENMRLARFCLLVGGVAWLLVGYQINKTTWFPPFYTTQGVLWNVIYSIGFLVVITILYKMLLKAKLKPPALLAGGLRRFCNSAVFAGLLVSFFGFNAYAYFKLTAHKPGGPNLVILTIDTLRADHIGCYGYHRDTSPNIDRLASEGIRFDQVYAQRGLTWPSLTSIMTALYPKTHGIRANQLPLNPEVITLAEILKNEGYKTGAFLANYFFASNRGFDIKKGGEIGDLDKQVTRHALDWLSGINPENDRFFLWLHQKNPHMPHEPPEPFTNMFDSTYTGTIDGSWIKVDSLYLNQMDLSERDFEHLVALYDAEIRSSDAYLQKILNKLRKMGVEDNTLVVFASDHGEELYEHNKYFYHSCSIYDSVLRIPLVFKFPGVLPENKVVESQVESIDIIPTVLDLMKMPLRDDFEGRSLMPYLFGNGVDESRQVFAERTASILATRTPQWKYIYNPDEYHPDCVSRRYSNGFPYYIGAEELYDIQNDPGETSNLAEQFPEIARDLRAQILQWVSTNKKTHKEIELTEEAKERLRALGYMK